MTDQKKGPIFSLQDSQTLETQETAIAPMGSTGSADTTDTTDTMTEEALLAKVMQCVNAAADKKAENIQVLDLRSCTAFTDYFVICSALSDRQVKAIADSVADRMRKQDMSVRSIEGYSEGRWVLMDCGSVVVHIFLDALREYYHLESLWAQAPRVPVLLSAAPLV